MDADKFRGQLTSINYASTMAAAARDYQKEILENERKQPAARPAWEDFDLDSLAEDPDLERLHAQRLADMRKEGEKRQEMRLKGHGEYREITEEKFLEEVTSSERVVLHFFHREFERCKIMDKHLRMLAPEHLGTKVVRIDAEKCPFFVSKLVIKVLPCVILFRDGVAIDRIVGFEELGGKDDFATAALLRRLTSKGLVVPLKPTGDEEEKHRQPNVRVGKWNDDSSDSD
eukprot:TRINITY_DN3237_c0_g2_i1.p1 TRINITY_DN3237_c0_g2~~TRINITY_DN3237_c0_g2_i1.p1  ORF type:complete len:230 (+),score=54.12 TRINITY_DN3237_c0_g2_i1:191-880(+)